MTQPETTAIVDQYFDGSAFSISKYKHRTAEWISGQDRPAQLRHAIYTFAEVGGLDGHEDLHLRGDLDHWAVPFTSP